MNNKLHTQYNVNNLWDNVNNFIRKSFFISRKMIIFIYKH
jgi:hypothetical protein